MNGYIQKKSIINKKIDIIRKVFKDKIKNVKINFFDRVKIRLKSIPLFDTSYAIEYNQPERLKKRINQIKKEFKKF